LLYHDGRLLPTPTFRQVLPIKKCRAREPFVSMIDSRRMLLSYLPSARHPVQFLEAALVSVSGNLSPLSSVSSFEPKIQVVVNSSVRRVAQTVLNRAFLNRLTLPSPPGPKPSLKSLCNRERPLIMASIFFFHITARLYSFSHFQDSDGAVSECRVGLSRPQCKKQRCRIEW
jgi:hypothetical protein